MAVNMKRSRESTTALVKEVCAHLSQCWHSCLLHASVQHLWIFIVLRMVLSPQLHMLNSFVPHVFSANVTLYSICISTQWRYDQTTATYLLLLSKKQRGKPVRLRPEPTVCEDSCSPLHQGIQVRLGTTTPKRLCSFSGLLNVFTTACSGSLFMTLPCTLHAYCFPVPRVFFCRSLIFFPPLTCRLGTPFTSARMKTQWLSVLSTFAQSTLMTVRGFQAHNTHPRGSEVSQMDLQTTKTWYVKAGKNVFLQPSLSLD